MSNNRELGKYGGQKYHVGDCYVWASISYLDSTTDYREYLPGNVQLSANTPSAESFVLLNTDRTHSFWNSLAEPFLAAYMLVLTHMRVPWM
jgi:hypothetical protein